MFNHWDLKYEEPAIQMRKWGKSMPGRGSSLRVTHTEFPRWKEPHISGMEKVPVEINKMRRELK